MLYSTYNKDWVNMIVFPRVLLWFASLLFLMLDVSLGKYCLIEDMSCHMHVKRIQVISSRIIFIDVFLLKSLIVFQIYQNISSTELFA
jgi:hypothetical protein